MLKSRKELISRVILELLESKVSIHLSQTKRVNYNGIDCNGFFDNTPELVFY